MKGKKEYVGLLLINVFIIVSVSLAAAVDNVGVDGCGGGACYIPVSTTDKLVQVHSS